MGRGHGGVGGGQILCRRMAFSHSQTPSPLPGVQTKASMPDDRESQPSRAPAALLVSGEGDEGPAPPSLPAMSAEEPSRRTMAPSLPLLCTLSSSLSSSITATVRLPLTLSEELG